MSTGTDVAPASGAEAVRWDLSPLYAGPDDPALEAEVTRAGERAKAFAETYRGQVGTLSASELATGALPTSTFRKRKCRAGRIIEGGQ